MKTIIPTEIKKRFKNNHGFKIVPVDTSRTHLAELVCNGETDIYINDDSIYVENKDVCINKDLLFLIEVIQYLNK